MKQNISLIVLLLSTTSLYAWQPAKAPLTTTWGEKIDPAHVWQEYPRPQMVRPDWQNLNGLWEFSFADAGSPIPFGRKLEREILVPFPWESALSGIREHPDSQRAWYRRSFTIPEKWNEQNILLHFGAVDWQAQVFINGALAGTHRGGYDAFSFDITPFLQKGSNELIVGVWDPGNDHPIARGKQQNNCFREPGRFHYSPNSGIWQTVWLEPVPSEHIESLQLIPDIDTHALTLNATLSTTQPGYSIAAEILLDGKSITTGTGAANAPFTIAFPATHTLQLWSPDTPTLYDLNITLTKDGQTLDTVTSYTGMRKIAMAKDETGKLRLYLNNHILFQMGVLDQGFWPDGIYTAPSDEALRWDLEQIKACGFNMVRKHVKIEPARWFHHCDQLGLLVWQDMPHGDNNRNADEKTQFEAELKKMVTQHWSHPSVVIWIVFNEHWGIYDVMRITPEIMALDPSRLVVGNSGYTAMSGEDWEIGHLKDVHIYRAPGTPELSANRASVLGEYGAIGYPIESHLWTPKGPWVHFNYKNKEAATAEYEKFQKMINGFIHAKKHIINAAVYTQWTDVENELNGIYTYDRKVEKLDTARVRAANEALFK